MDSGYSYTIKPTKQYYHFQPDSIKYSGISSDKTQNFTAVVNNYTFSGVVTCNGKAVSGVTLQVLGGTSLTTNANGSFSVSFPALANYTITPSKIGYKFTPSSFTITNLTGNITQNFLDTRPVYTLSGNITGATGVTFTLSGGKDSVITNALSYSFRVDSGWTYTITPSKSGYYFTPPNITISNFTGNQNNSVTGTLMGTLLFIGLNELKIIFDSTEIGKTKTFQFKYKNGGAAGSVYPISKISISGDAADEFLINGETGPVELEKDAEKTITISFAPKTTGIRVGRISIITTNTLVPGVEVSLRGIGKEGLPLIPDKPAFVSPLNNSLKQPINPTIWWNITPRAISYDLQISKSNDFTNPLYTYSAISDTFKIMIGLQNRTQYFIRLKANNISGGSIWSDTIKFTTIAPLLAKPTLLSPNKKAIKQPINLTLKWNSISGATKYNILVGSDSTLTTKIFFSDSTLIDTSKSLMNLKTNTIYYWTVQGKNEDNNSEFSDKWNFTTLNTVPSSSSIISPTNNEVIELKNPTKTIEFRWTKSTDADEGDRVQYIISVSGSGLDKKVESISDSLVFLDIMSQLKLSTIYYWFVLATDGRDTVKSAISAFKTSDKITRIENISGSKVESFELRQNYPNPFNPETRIEYCLPDANYVSLIIYNIYGEEVEILVNKSQFAGRYTLSWHPKNVPSGVYYYRLKSGSFNETRRMIYLR